MFRNKEVQLYTNGEKLFYQAGESVEIPASTNTNGLWVLTPMHLQNIVLDGLK